MRLALEGTFQQVFVQKSPGLERNVLRAFQGTILQPTKKLQVSYLRLIELW